MMKKPPKISNLIDRIRSELENGNERYVDHALERLQQRQVTRQEVRQVLRAGFHEKRKDTFKEEYGSWSYSVRGKTVDKRTLRVVVSLEENLLVITVIDLDK